MAETIITPGLVLREQSTGERDRIITILTEKLGVVRAFANGSKSLKSRTASSTDLFCFSKFTLSRSGSNVFTVREASVIDIFFRLRENIVFLALAQYFSEIAVELSPREDSSTEQLHLILNALSLLSDEKKPKELIKSVVELRLLTLSGYMPSIVACDICGCYESEKMVFDPKSGKLWCQSCAEESGQKGREATLGVISAMRFICFSEPERVFSFSLSPGSQSTLSALSEEYLRFITGKTYTTLDFYKQMTD